MKFLIIFFFIFSCNLLYGQKYIKGSVFTIDEKEIINANVILFFKDGVRISAFAITNSEGFFKITYNNVEDSVLLKISIVGYKTQNLKIINQEQTLKFILEQETTQLPTVIVKENPINTSGDTTKYLVKNFFENEDRVIGDVIAKLPGVEIDETSGQIKFNGKAISHYYIDGLDLLEKKYNIANRNIPADLVEQVQLLNNHQDIQLFDSIKTSSEVALNIKLKKKAKNKLIGKAKVGLGIVPLLWDNEITALQFNTKFQLITSYKNNNAGSLLANELSDNISVQKVGEKKEENNKTEIINSFNIQQPNISTRRYLFNNTHLFNFNVLRVLPNKAQLKFNTSYLNDNTSNENSLQTIYTLPNGRIINFNEKRNSFINTNKVEGNIIYNLNTKKIYLKNILNSTLDFTNENSTINNPNKVSQTLQNPYYKYANDFLIHLPVKKKIISISSKINFNRMPQQLDILPGQFKDVYNQSIDYDQIMQKAVLSNFNTDNNIAFTSKICTILQQLKIGSEFIYKNLQTNVSKLYKQNEFQLSDSFKNNINWNNTRIYLADEFTIGKGKRQLNIILPVELNVLNVKNNIEKYKQNSTNIFFNPNLDFTFPIFDNSIGNISYTFQNSLGSVSNIYSGYILNNYRNLNRNDSLIPIQKEQNLNTSLYYKNSLKAIFSNISISASTTKRNIIFSQVFDGFFIKSVGSYINNYLRSLMFTGNTSKYFIEAKINLTLNYSYSIFQTDILQQDFLAKSKSKIISFGFKSHLNMLSYVSIETNSKYDFFKNEIKQSLLNTTSTNRFQQFLRLYFYLSKKSTLYFNNELYKVWDNVGNKGNYFFGDVVFKQKFKNTELELEWNNFTNSTNYTTINNTENLKQIHSFKIRPTNLIVKFYFNF